MNAPASTPSMMSESNGRRAFATPTVCTRSAISPGEKASDPNMAVIIRSLSGQKERAAAGGDGCSERPQGAQREAPIEPHQHRELEGDVGEVRQRDGRDGSLRGHLVAL